MTEPAQRTLAGEPVGQVDSDDEDPPDKTKRDLICLSCDTHVRAHCLDMPQGRTNGFVVGCDCLTVPVVPQMGMPETPEKWVVVRPGCCEDRANRATVYDSHDDPWLLADEVCCQCGRFWSRTGGGRRDETFVGRDPDAPNEYTPDEERGRP